MKRSVVVMVVILTAILLFAGCGSSGSSTSSVEGVYKFEAGGNSVTLTLKADGKATISLTGSGGVPIDYKVKDGTVVLIGADGKETANGSYKIEDDGLRDQSGNLYKKQ
jgi:uncharacterized protein YceK